MTMTPGRMIAFVFLLSVSFILVSVRAHAAPAFARQTGFACNTCHFQHYPALNAFGRSFKAGGYIMVGGQSMVEGDLLNLPVVLNASLITKIRYQKTNGPSDLTDKKNRGEFQFPDEGALLLGGRVGEHIGFLLEAQLKDPDGSAWASFKMPVVYDVMDTKVSVTPFTTDAMGPAYGFELLNTGAMRIQRILEHRKEISAQQYLGTPREATGFSFAAYRDFGHLNYAMWSPEHGSTDAKPYLHYVRGVVTPVVSGWDLGVGFQIWDGETRFTEDTTTTTVDTAGAGCPSACPVITTTITAFEKVTAEAWSIDAQAQGAIGNMPLGVYLTHGVAKESGSGASDPTNIFNSETTGDREATTALVELGIIPNRLTIAAAYRVAETGATINNDEDATTVGATYLVAQNFELQVNHTWYDFDNDPPTGNRLLTLMIFAAF